MTRNDDQRGTGQKQQATDTGKDPATDMASWKPGSDASSAKDVKAEGDFGVPTGSGTTREREYVSENTKRSDPGTTAPFSHEFEGRRTAGAGARYDGDGSGSGGDLDPDFVGVGTGGSGVAASPPRGTSGPDDSDGSSNEMASGGPALGHNQGGVHRVGGSRRVAGTTFDRAGGDLQSTPLDQGADAATNPAARGDDSFAAEVSTGEAMGEDNPIEPSQESQGLSQDDAQAYPQKDMRGDA